MVDPRELEAAARMEARLVAPSAELLASLGSIFTFLEDSEQQMLALIQYVHDRKKPPIVPAQGDVEFGFVLYWLDNPPAEILAWLKVHPLLQGAWDLLKALAPKTKITTNAYNQLIAELGDYGEPWTDGTLYGDKYKYQQLDPLWMLAALNYVANLIDPASVHPFPNNAVATIALSRKDGNTAKDPVLGIVGDWGTGYYVDEGGGPCPAQRVMAQITNPALSPAIDYLIHLGDVYYAGTDWRPAPGEEQGNFYSLWPNQGPARNFTLNSNHEMYGAASGYFDVALQQSGLFAAQNGMSYFAMTYGPWLVLGLDSGYYSDALNGYKFYMEGGIGSASHTQQIDWVKQFRTHRGPIMVMTHHTGCDTLTSQINPLFSQVRAALGKSPSLWYWGHVHNGIVYDRLHDYTGIPVVAYPTRGRCAGHGAIPFGNAWGLETGGPVNPNILYYAHTPDPALPDTAGANPLNPRVRNGYALVTLHKNGGATEAFYEAGATSPVWQQTWTATQLAAEPDCPGD